MVRWTDFRLLAAALLLASAHHASALTALSDCRLHLAEANLAWLKGYQKEEAACLKQHPGSDCRFGLGSPTRLLEEALTPGSVCDTALTGGATLQEIMGSPVCPASFGNCQESDPVTGLNDVRNCHRCQQVGLRVRGRFDMDEAAVVSQNGAEASCLSGLYKAMSKAAQSGVQDAVRCATTTGDLPWSCPVSSSSDSKLARRLSKIAKVARRCEEPLAAEGSSLRRLCNQSMFSSADLDSCFRRMALCHSCLAANQALGADQDCVSFSGDRFCDASLDDTHGLTSAVGFFVTNRADDSLTSFHGSADYAFGTLEASTFPVGDQPVAAAYDNHAGAVFVANRGDSTVVVLNATTGAPLQGALPASTRVVGQSPSAIAVHADLGMVYVANEGDGTVTMLDMLDGSYVAGDLASSSVAAGTSPAALAVDEASDIVYVADAATDEVIFLRAVDGLPLFGTHAASSFPVGAEPRALHLYETAEGPALLVTNHGDGTITRLDATTGAPVNGTLAASTTEAGTGAIASAVLDYTTSFFDPHGATFSALREGDALVGSSFPVHETAAGPAAAISVPAGGNPTDLRLSTVGSPFRHVLLTTLGNTDQLAVAPIVTDYSLIGLTAMEDAMMELPTLAWGLTSSSAGDVLVASEYWSLMPIVDPLTRTIREAVADGENPTYSAENDIVYVTTTGFILMLDATTGQYENGALETSRFAAPCSGNWLGDIAVSDATDTLLVACGSSVYYLDSLTGAPKTGDLSTSVLDTGDRPHALHVDDTNGRFYTVVETGSTTSGVLVMNTASPGYAYGTMAASTRLDANVDAWATKLAIAPSLNLLYRSFDYTGEVLMYDLDDFEPVGSTALPIVDYAPVDGMTVDAAKNRLYVSRGNAPRPGRDVRVADIVYLEANSGDYVGSTFEDSAIAVELHRSGTSQNLPVTVSTPGALVVLMKENDYLPINDGLLFLDPYVPQPLGSAQTYQKLVSTGGEPSSITMVTQRGD